MMLQPSSASDPKPMKTQIKLTFVIAASLMLRIGAHAADVSLNANDGVGTSSFNAAGHWSNGQAPSGANNYFTAGFFMRTPGDAVTNYVFAGASLTLGPANLSGGVNGSMLEKFGPGAGSGEELCRGTGDRQRLDGLEEELASARRQDKRCGQAGPRTLHPHLGRTRPPGPGMESRNGVSPASDGRR